MGQIEQWTTDSNVFGPNWYLPDNADQNIDGLPAAEHRTQPPVVDKFCDDLLDDGISQGFLAVEMVVERSFGDIGGGENGIDARTLEA